MVKRSLDTWLRVVAIAVAMLGGVFVGLFSCGGYAWHHQAIVVAITLVTAASLITRFRFRGFALWRCIGFIVLVVSSYFFSEADAAPFYPAPPASFSEFWRSFIQTLEYGPC